MGEMGFLQDHLSLRMDPASLKNGRAALFQFSLCIGRGKYAYISVSIQLNLSDVFLRFSSCLNIPY